MTTKTKEKNNQSKDDIITLLCNYRLPIMGISCLWIFLFHVWVPLLGDVAYLGKFEFYFLRMGYVGVDIFFLLSGIGLVYSISKHSLSVYYYRRIKRILISFLLAGIFIRNCKQMDNTRILRKCIIL